MRIIAGEHKGRPLVTPRGLSTRPTGDRVRESLMSTLISERTTLEGAYVLDLFAGSGALAVEALSRGAACACLCDRNRAALDAIAKNTSFFEKERVYVMRIDVEKRLPRALNQPYDIVFIDPPYALSSRVVADRIESLIEAGLLQEGTLLCYEHDTAQDTEPLLSLLWPAKVIAHKVYGDTIVDIIRIFPKKEFEQVVE